MSRFAAIISKSELLHKIAEVTHQTIEEIIDGELDHYALCGHPTVADDLSKVQFDLENYEYQTANDFICSHIHDDAMANIIGIQHQYPPTHTAALTFLGCWAGGDWEMPIFFVIYWDGKNLRAYIPKKGNTWSTKTKSAYGNDENEPADDAPEFNPKELLSDVLSRIKVKGTKK